MVAIVHNSGSIRNALHYNENKVQKSAAECIHSMNYPKDTGQLSVRDKLNRLINQTKLNQRTKINSVHISLNFDSADKLDNEKLAAIAETYMQGIGFGEQPYLVYQHHDAGHPHIHIVTTNIQSDGKRIELHNLGSNLSMKVSKQIEKGFGLVEALSKSRENYNLKPVDVYKVQYGKRETKRAITNVLDAVLPYYKYASLPELNAVLREYNILADRGSEDSRVFRAGGLVYRILNEKGEKIGIPIKASLIYNKPTLKTIQSKFLKNKEDKEPFKQRVRTSIDFALAKGTKINISSLQQSLIKDGIRLHLRQNESGVVYGLTYIDHKSKCVFNGSDLGKQYSANAMQYRCDIDQTQAIKPTISLSLEEAKTVQNHNTSENWISGILQNLIQTENEPIAGEFKEDQQKRKRRKKQNK